MKIRFLLHDAFDQGGGVLSVALALAEELSRRHDVEIISVFGGGRPVHRHPRGVKVSVLTSGRAAFASRLPTNRRLTRQPSALVPPQESRYEYYSLWTDRLLRRRLEGLRGGALVTMQPALSIAAARIAPRDCVLVAQEHVPFARRPRRILKAYRQHAADMDTFLTLTRSDAKRFRSWMQGRVPVRAIPNGLPPYDGRRSDHVAPLAVAAGRLGHIKGFDVLIEAWRHVVARHPEWQLEIWGEGDLEDELRRQISGAGLARHVHLRGYSNRLQAELARASIFVLSSRAEGYPRVIQEAMACALPVVSTDCPSGPSEMITDGVDGRLVASEDPQALAAAIVELIEGGVAGRRSMGAAAEARVREMGQDVIARRWERLLGRLEEERVGRRIRRGA